jgi:maleylacetate reductase
MRFVHESSRQRVCFAAGEAARMLGEEVERLDASRVMVIAAPPEARIAAELSTDIPAVHRHNEVAMHVPASEVVTDPAGPAGREQMLCGTYLSAVAFSSSGSGLHHKICHVLGGKYNLPHAQMHAVVLPYVLAFNAPAEPDAEQRLATAFGASSALTGLQRLRQAVDAPRALRDYGFDEADIDSAVPAIEEQLPAGNPRPVTGEDLRRLLSAAWQGAAPRTMTANEES